MPIKNFFKNLFIVLLSTLKAHFICAVFCSILLCTLYKNFNIINLMFNFLLYYINMTILYSILTIFNLIKYRKITKIEEENGRYSNEYYNAFEEMILKEKPNAGNLQLILLALRYLEGDRNTAALETLKRVNILNIPDKFSIKAIYYMVLAEIMIRNNDISSADRVMLENKKLIEKHRTNLINGWYINYIICMLEYVKGNCDKALEELNERVYRRDIIDKFFEEKLRCCCYLKKGNRDDALLCLQRAEKKLETTEWWQKEQESPKLKSLKESLEPN